ncbi:phosphocholine cytidylyltransferase family protein [Sulfurimonas sp. SAG-AH-194-I05]|nr:phosphocholine cytidylyltransferase family protein [Sulfurimonas sp. SAG-AH-194-I05]MDF1875017.1 phosphocholine cytidylyltransferase family protein [Sulfurimonas sp. SAG-AH-194-I05]
MKVLMLAAGVGTRISRYLGDHPKCCVEVGSKPLIRRTMELLYRHNITDIAIVVGYQEKYIHEALKGFDYTTYKNPFYKVTNSIASMWFAKDFMDSEEDFLILNADLFIEDSMLERLIVTKKSPIFLSDSTRIEDADYRFNWEGDRLLRFGKELTNEETTGEYVGIAKIAKEDIKTMKAQLEYLVDQGEYNMWWEDVFYSLVETGKPIYVEDIKGSFWAEVDFIEDYNRILDYIAKKE